MSLPQTFPALYTQDLAGARAFYCDLLGFEELYRFPPEGEPTYVSLERNGGRLGLAAVPDSVPNPSLELWTYVESVDAVVDRLRAEGVDVLREPADQPWAPGTMRQVDPGTLQALARHAEAIATVRTFAARSAAERVALLLDAGEGAEAVLLECTAGGEVEVTEAGAGFVIPADAALPAPARGLPDVRPAPASAIAIEPETGELSAPLGTVQHLADAVLGLARAFGGRTVATAEFATRDPGLPITLAAREGEPTVLAAGDQSFFLP